MKKFITFVVIALLSLAGYCWYLTDQLENERWRAYRIEDRLDAVANLNQKLAEQLAEATNGIELAKKMTDFDRKEFVDYRYTIKDELASVKAVSNVIDTRLEKIQKSAESTKQAADETAKSCEYLRKSIEGKGLSDYSASK